MRCTSTGLKMNIVEVHKCDWINLGFLQLIEEKPNIHPFPQVYLFQWQFDNVNVVSTESSPLKLQKTPGNDKISNPEPQGSS